MSDMYPAQFNDRGDLAPPNYGYTANGDPIYFQFNDRGDVTVQNLGYTGQGDMIAFPTTAHGDLAPYDRDTDILFQQIRMRQYREALSRRRQEILGQQIHAYSASVAARKAEIENSPSGNEGRKIDAIQLAMRLATQKDGEVGDILADPIRYTMLRHEWSVSFGLEKMVRRGYLPPDRSRRSLDEVQNREYADEEIAATMREITLTDEEIRQEGYGEIQADGTRSSEAGASLGRIMNSNTTRLTLFEMWFTKQLYDLRKVA